jgi:hypothetical protein
MEYTIKLNEQQMTILGVALGKLPYEAVFQLVNEINRQATQQLQEKKSDPA